MEYTIHKVCEGCKYQAHVDSITLDSITPMESNLSYVEDGKYTKNGNWAVATVRLAVEMELDGKTEEISYDIEMRSGQLTKIKMAKDEFKAMVAEVFDIKVA